MIEIDEITSEIAEDLCRKLTLDLPEYFGLPDISEHYALGVKNCTNLAAKIENKYIGLISIDFPYQNNANIYWMAVLEDFHNLGVGRKLVGKAFNLAKSNNASSMTVETLDPLVADENYLKTYKFYQLMGFMPLFNLKPQNYEWNMVYMIKFIT